MHRDATFDVNGRVQSFVVVLIYFTRTLSLEKHGKAELNIIEGIIELYLSKHHNHLDPRRVLVTEDVVHEGGAGIPARVESDRLTPPGPI